MELGFGPPNEALARELRQVARAAELLVTALDKLNAPLPESFPEQALRDECAALAGLVEGTAEGCRVPLDVASGLLPKMRREHFLEDTEEEGGEGAPPLHREGVLDARMAALIVADTTARDEVRHQARDQFDDTTRAEETIAVDRPTTARLRDGADRVVAGVEAAVGELDAKGVSASASGAVLRRRLRDGENLSLLAKAQVSAVPTVRRWITATGMALKRTPDLIEAAGKAVKAGADWSKPLLDWWHNFERDAVEALRTATDELGDALIAVALRMRGPRSSAPQWAADHGEDQYGRWLDFEYKGVRQRLRWIEAGSFLMGSPEGEEGRRDSEGPQREVIIGEGFWFLDTPVTQALYTAVLDENPSVFKGLDRPVEQVSWFDAQSFVERLNNAMPGLALRLPSEAEWEYACRAGTRTAIYRQPLADIAWFDANSGSETRPVRGKTPNGWGLYDMLGNVFEWCADHWQPDYSRAPGDGRIWVNERSRVRVVRGGSWGVEAQYCRAAYRSRNQPGLRVGFLGFRPARGQG